MNSIFQEGVVRTNYSAKPSAIWLPLKEDQRLTVSQGALKLQAVELEVLNVNHVRSTKIILVTYYHSSV